jgi:hypothetical protein
MDDYNDLTRKCPVAKVRISQVAYTSIRQNIIHSGKPIANEPDLGSMNMEMLIILFLARK